MTPLGEPFKALCVHVRDNPIAQRPPLKQSSQVSMQDSNKPPARRHPSEQTRRDHLLKGFVSAFETSHTTVCLVQS